MIKHSIVLIFFMLSTVSLFAQRHDLFIPRQMQEAYKAGTRSYSGKPGENYFQNKSIYNIEAEFNPETGMLNGHEVITYHNNSPDALNRIVIRLYMNLFEKGVERDFGIGTGDLHEGIKIEKLVIAGKDMALKDNPTVRESGTIMTVKLPNSLAASDKLKVEMDWRVQLPDDVTIRMGKYNDDSWFVGYWYPQISVYDDVSGWDTHPFTGSAEFYYDFNDYNVKISVPENYMVWGSGILQNPGGHYRESVHSRLNKARKTNEVVHVTTAEDVDKGRVLLDNQDEYWRFSSENEGDFAFAVSRKYIWDATSVEVDEQTGRRVLVSAVYDRNSSDFHQVAEISAETIRLFSEKYIGVPFPHPKLTAFNGEGGMEFPMMINDGDAGTYEGTVHLTTHEIGHNYYPFYVGTNESYYAFVDEGLVSYVPRLVAGEIATAHDPLSSLFRGFSRQAGSMFETPLMVKSYMISDYRSYRVHAYTRPANAFHFLREMVGKKDFRKALQAYTKRWAHKHPTPYDLFYTFEDVLNKDLSWYWKPWFFRMGYPDLSIEDVKSRGGDYYVTVLRKGSLPVPAKLTVRYSDGTTTERVKQASIWKDGKEQVIFVIPMQEGANSFVLNNTDVPDAFPKDNTLELQQGAD